MTVFVIARNPCPKSPSTLLTWKIQSGSEVCEALSVYSTRNTRPEYPDLAVSNSNMSLILNLWDSEALKCAKDCLRIEQDLNTQLWLLLMKHTQIYPSLGQYNEALKYLKGCIRIRQELLGFEHVSYNNTSQIYQTLGSEVHECC